MSEDTNNGQGYGTDVRIKFRNTKVSKGNKGQDILSLYVNQEDVLVLLDALAAQAENDKGVKLMIHTYTRANSSTGVAFQSSEMFIKAVQEYSGKSFAVRAKETVAAVTAKAARPTTTAVPRTANGASRVNGKSIA